MFKLNRKLQKAHSLQRLIQMIGASDRLQLEVKKIGVICRVTSTLVPKVSFIMIQ